MILFKLMIMMPASPMMIERMVYGVMISMVFVADVLGWRRGEVLIKVIGIS